MMNRSMISYSQRLLTNTLRKAIALSSIPFFLCSSHAVEKAEPEKPAAEQKAKAAVAAAEKNAARTVPMPPALVPAQMPAPLGLAALPADHELVKTWSPLLADQKAAEVLKAAEAEAAKGNEVAYFVSGWLHASGKLTQDGKPDIEKAEKSYRAAAEKKHQPSQFNLAHLLLSSDKAEKRKEAADLFAKLAETDAANAGLWAGYASIIGAGAEPDFASATEWWRATAEADNAEAYLHLGLAYSGQYGFPARTDYVKAAQYWKQGAEKNHAGCALRLGHFLLADAKLAGMKDEDCLAYVKQASEAQLAEGTFLLAEIRRGAGYGQEKKEPESAAGLYQLAAEAGYVPAMLRLAEMLEAGEGAAKDEKGACAAWSKAASQGSAVALWKLAQVHRDGTHGREKDEKMALKAAMDAAVRGSAPAAGLLGESYRKGELGLMRDALAARTWLQQAAQASDGQASTQLAEMMLAGEAPMGKADELRALLIQGVSAKVSQAGYLLARLMLDGRVLQKSVPAAHAWMKWAAEQGHKQAGDDIKNLEKQMNEQEKQQAAVVFKDLQTK